VLSIWLWLVVAAVEGMLAAAVAELVDFLLVLQE
jgi:hypothetical protein